jgi:hypothetical protein
MKSRAGYLLLATTLLGAALAGWWRWGERIFVVGLGALC